MPRKLNYTYDELVEKARTIFWVHGYKNVSPEELAQHLEVSASTIRNKFTKEMLFMDTVKSYMSDLSDPFLDALRGAENGIEDLRKFFYMVVEALLTKQFPRSCYMMNTVMEMRTEEEKVAELYNRYIVNMQDAYKTALKRAVAMGEISRTDKLDEYAEHISGLIFSLSVLYKVKSEEELKYIVDDQLSLME
jgi:TetR/AcrR family transcriptional repressor of nem operon